MEYYLTPERLKELKDELAYLKTEKKSEIAERLQHAKELGDLSENSEYFEAREEQGLVEQRIFELEQITKNAKVIEKPKNHAVVGIGSTIQVEKGDQKMTLKIVGSNEVNPEQGLISNESPLGKSFLGKRAGDRVIVKAPMGEITYTIVKIE